MANIFCFEWDKNSGRRPAVSRHNQMNCKMKAMKRLLSTC